ncbi:hypothetical protein B0H14DRAFT_2641344 [Mycena olivaceomarginata]|nr:hypothetical protein B0H14DRAFT_2641344 [Mycena olivaceomarginata]
MAHGPRRALRVDSLERYNPPVQERKRGRTQVQARERAKMSVFIHFVGLESFMRCSYRLDPTPTEEDHVRYFREGPGTVYFTAQRDDRGLIVKWGESTCLPRRQLEYDEYGAGKTQMWFGAFEENHSSSAAVCAVLGKFAQIQTGLKILLYALFSWFATWFQVGL